MKVLIMTNSDIGLYKFRKELIEELISEKNTVYITAPKGEYLEKITALGCRYLDTPLERRGMNPLKDIRHFFVLLYAD